MGYEPRKTSTKNQNVYFSKLKVPLIEIHCTCLQQIHQQHIPVGQQIVEHSACCVDLELYKWKATLIDE